MKKKIIKLTESDLERIVRKIISEVGGYDDKDIMGRHASHVMYNLSETYNDLSNMLSGLIESISYCEATKEEIVENLSHILDSLDGVKHVMSLATKDFTEDSLVNWTRILTTKIEQFQKRATILVNYSQDMGNYENYTNKIVELLMDFVKYVKTYGDELEKTNNLFKGRFNSNQNMN